jgi:DNA-binding response OmpR family regulator
MFPFTFGLIVPMTLFHPTHGTRILVADADASLAQDLRRFLTTLGYEVLLVSTLLEAHAALSSTDSKIDLVVTGIDLGESDGRAILADPVLQSIPVILYTTRTLPADVIAGLDMGADDYLAKSAPFSVLESRIRAVLRRTRHASTTEPPVYSFEGLCIDTGAHEVTVAGQLVDLTAKEFSLLSFLAASPHQVFSRNQILGHVWGSSDAWQSAATVTEHIHRIRSKIEGDPTSPRWIITVAGAGYKFERRLPR